MRLFDAVRDGTSVLPLLRRLSQLGPRPDPEELVDCALTYKVIRPIQHRRELVELARLVATLQPKTLLEIGTFRGGTLFVFARLAAPDATIISLDLPISRMGRLYRVAQEPLFHKFTLDRQDLHLLRKNSHAPATKEEVQRILGGRPLDFLFIDGDHAYESVKRDFEQFAPLVDDQGVIAFHDIAMGPPSGVAKFWRELSKYPVRTEFVHDTIVRPMGIGVVWKTTPQRTNRAERGLQPVGPTVRHKPDPTGPSLPR